MTEEMDALDAEIARRKELEAIDAEIALKQQNQSPQQPQQPQPAQPQTVAPQPEKEISTADRILDFGAGGLKAAWEGQDLMPMGMNAFRNTMLGLFGDEEAQNRSFMENLQTPIPMATEGWDQIADALGAEGIIDKITGRFVEEGDSPVADTLRVGAEFGLGNPVSVLKGVAKKSGNIADLAADLLPNIKDAPIDAVKRGVGKVKDKAGDVLAESKYDALAGGGAMVGDAVADEEGQLIGGIGMPLLAATFGRTGNLNKIISKDFDRAQEAFINNVAGDPEEVLKKYYKARKSGEKGSIGVITGDEGLLNLEARAKQDPKIAKSLNDLDAAVNQQHVDNLQAKAPTTIDELGESQQSRVAGAGETVDRRFKQGEQQAGVREQAGQETFDQSVADLEVSRDARGVELQDAQDVNVAAQAELKATDKANLDAERSLRKAQKGVKPTGTLGDASKGLVKSVGGDRKKAKDAVAKLWKAFTAGEPINKAEFIAPVNEAIEGMSAASRSIFEKDFKDVLQELKKVTEGGDVDLDDISTVISFAKQRLDSQDFAKPAMAVSKKELRNVIKAMDRSLESAGMSGELYKKARDASKQMFDAYDNPDLQRRIKKRGRRKPSQVLDNMGGTAGATMVDDLEALAKGTGRGDDHIVDGLIAKAKGEYHDNITPSFMAEHEEVLSRYPQVKKAFDDILDAKAGAETTGSKLTKSRAAADKTAKAEGKASDAQQRASERVEDMKVSEPKVQSRLAKTREADIKKARTKAKGEKAGLSKTVAGRIAKDPVKFVKSLLTKDKSYRVGELTDAVTTGKRVDGGVEKLQSAVINQLLSDAKQVIGTDAKLAASTASKFGELADDFVKSGLFTKKQADELTEMFKRTDVADMRKESLAGNVVTPKLGTKLEAISSFLGSAIGTRIPLSSGLVMTGIMRRVAKGQMNFKGKETEESIRMLNNMLANPKAFTSGLSTDELAKIAVGGDKALEVMSRRLSDMMNRRGRSLIQTTAQLADKDEQGDN